MKQVGTSTVTTGSIRGVDASMLKTWIPLESELLEKVEKQINCPDKVVSCIQIETYPYS